MVEEVGTLRPPTKDEFQEYGKSGRLPKGVALPDDSGKQFIRSLDDQMKAERQAGQIGTANEGSASGD